MTALSQEIIRSFITRQIEYWNAGNIEAFTELYSSVSPNALIIEYVG